MVETVKTFEEKAGQITEKNLQAAFERFGIEMVSTDPFNEYATEDAIRHYSQGIGDTNPLYYDGEYAKKTRWGRLIAPPSMALVDITGVSEKKELTKEDRSRGRGALAGVHAWWSGETMEFFRPIYAGDRLTVRGFASNLQIKRSEFSGITAHRRSRRLYWNQKGELVTMSESLSIAGGRETTPGERKKYATIERPTFTPEEITRLDEAYEHEEIRGANPRYWEDVNIGDETTPMLKGPITITDIINWAAGAGQRMTKGAHRWQYLYRKRHPLAYVVNEQGVPDAIERVHWDDAFARHTGNPYCYDYGPQRMSWLINAMTSWEGDDGWLRKIDAQLRRFVYIGDVIWLKGKVTEKYIKDDECTLELDVWCEDHRGRNTAPAHAVVLLPSRQHGPVKIPPKMPTPEEFLAPLKRRARPGEAKAALEGNPMPWP